MVKDILIDEFQYMANDILTRNKSIMDIITKYQVSNSRLNREIIKAATQCGCIELHAKKQVLPADCGLEDMKEIMKTNVHGNLCNRCRELIEENIGENLFYLVSICNTFDLNLYDVMLKELEKVNILGKYNLK